MPKVLNFFGQFFVHFPTRYGILSFRYAVIVYLKSKFNSLLTHFCMFILAVLKKSFNVEKIQRAFELVVILFSSVYSVKALALV